MDKHKQGLVRSEACVIHVKPCKTKYKNKVIEVKLKLIFPACSKRTAKPAVFLCFSDGSGFH